MMLQKVRRHGGEQWGLDGRCPTLAGILAAMQIAPRAASYLLTVKFNHESIRNA